MSSSSSNTSATTGGVLQVTPPAAPRNPSIVKRVFMSIGLPAWVFAGFMAVQIIVAVVIEALKAAGVSFEAVNQNVFSTILGAIVYILAIALVIGLPWLIRFSKTTLAELGLRRLPQWTDFVWLLAGFFEYFVFSAVLAWGASEFLPFFKADQVQETGYINLTSQFEYIIAFIGLVVVAPLFEEILFRGYLLGKLRKYTQFWISLLITSLLFALVHFQWNVGVDVFALSVVSCVLRLITGSLWSSIMLHMLKNGIAYYFLFINPITTPL